MKKICVLIFSIFLFQSTLPAQSYKVTYEKIQQGGVKVVGVTDPAVLKRLQSQRHIQTYQLLHKNGVSNFYWDRKIRKQNENVAMSLDDKSTTQKHIILGGKKPSILYKDLAHKSYLKNSNSLGRPVLIKDKLPDYDWKISKETKLIGEYVCKKATAIKDKEQITAWYTTSVPVKDGPDKYYGLSGLIIELNYKNKTYRAISVVKQDIEITVPHEKKIMNQAKYDKKFEEVKKSIMMNLSKQN